MSDNGHLVLSGSIAPCAAGLGARQQPQPQPQLNRSRVPDARRNSRVKDGLEGLSEGVWQCVEYVLYWSL